MPSVYLRFYRVLKTLFIIAIVLPIGLIQAQDIHFSPVLDTYGNAISSVRSLFNDPHGFLWLGGDAGVFRFDGYNTIKVNAEPTRGLYKDDTGQLWSAGTTTLAALDRATYQSIPYPNLSNSPQKRDHEIINDMLITYDGRQFFATDEGLSEYLRSQDRFVHYTLTLNGVAVAVTALQQSREDKLYIGTSKGLFEMPQLTFEHQTNTQVKLPPAITEAVKISDISIATDEMLLIGSDNGLYTVSRDHDHIKHFSHDINDKTTISSNNVTALLVDNQGFVWTGTSNGLNLFSPHTGQFKRFFHHPNNPSGISNNLITSLYQDRQDNILIATYSGINRYHHLDIHLLPTRPQSYHDQSINNVWSLAEDKQQTRWVGTFGSGLFRSDKSQITNYSVDINNPHSIISNRISTVLLDSKERLWVGTSKGLQLFDVTTQRFHTIEPLAGKGTIFDINESIEGDIWLATLSGVTQLSGLGKQLAVYNKQSKLKVPFKQWVRTVLPIDNRVLIGADTGLHVLNTERQTVRHFEEVGSVVKIIQDSEQNIWVLALEGLALFDRDEQTITQMTVLDEQAPTNGCNGMVEDDFKQLWLVCNDGLKVLDIVTRELIATFAKQDGIDLSGFLTGTQSMIKNQSGEILLGERKGLTRFVPAPQRQLKPSTKVTLTQVDLSTDERQLSDPANPFGFTFSPGLTPLPEGLQKIEFQFSSLDISRPQSGRYQYQLAGFEHSWNTTGAENRRAIYTNLPSGDYRFKVQVHTATQSSKIAEYPFSIAPKPWQSWWAYLLYIMTLTLMVYGFVVFRTRSLIRRSVALEQNIALRTEELQTSKNKVEQLMTEREKLIENIYHQTRTPVQLMLGNIDTLVAKEFSIDTYAKKQKSKIHALMHLTDQILDVSRVTCIAGQPLEKVDLSAVLKPLILGFKDVAELKKLTFNSIVDESMAVMGLPNSLENAIDNVLSNAVKYTDAGEIRFTANQQNNKIVIVCSDTGIGIPKQDLQNIFRRYQRAGNTTGREGAGIGLAMVKEVIDAHGGQIELSSEPDKGTSMKVTLPAIDCSQVANHELLHMQPDTKQQHKPTILIVEDNLELMGYLCKLLCDEYHLLRAINGEDGLKQALHCVPDIIVSDIMMDPMDGYELTTQIRQDDITCHIPILLVTAKSDKDSKSKGYALGASDFITKPFVATDLLNRIGNQIKLLQNQACQSGQPHNVTAQNVTAQNEEDRLITRYLLFVSENYQNNELKIKDICEALHISIRQLERKVRHFLSMTPNELLNDYRLSRAQEQLEQGQNISDVYHDCGFSSHAYFSKRYKEKFGQLPSQHKNASKNIN